MAKFKVGDKVRVKHGLEERHYNSDCLCIPVMVAAAGEEAVIEKVFGIDQYFLRFQRPQEHVSPIWKWSDDMLEKVKTLKELPNTVVQVKTREEYDELMRIYEDAGWKWGSGNKPTEFDAWDYYDQLCIGTYNLFGFGSKKCSEEYGEKVISLDEFKRVQGITVEFDELPAYQEMATKMLTHWYGLGFEVTETPTKPKNTMAKLSMLAKKLLDADTRALVKAGVLNESLEVRDSEFILSFIVDAYKKDLAKEARKRIREMKKEEEE